MLCVGCPTEAFHTLEDVARIHGISLEQLELDEDGRPTGRPGEATGTPEQSTSPDRDEG